MAIGVGRRRPVTAAWLILAVVGPGTWVGGARAQTAPARLGPETPVADSVESLPNYDRGDPDVAAGPNGYLAIWSDERQCCDRLVYGNRLDRDGNVLDPLGFPITPAGTSAYDAQVVWDGHNYLVVYETFDIEAVRVTEDGEVLDDPPITIAADEEEGGFEPDVASTGKGALAVWAGCAEGSCVTTDIYAATIQSDGSTGEPFPLVEERRRQDEPSITAGPNGYVVTWHEAAGNRTVHRMMMVDESGRPIGPQTDLPAPGSEFEAAYDGNAFLQAWHGVLGDEGAILARRIGPSGEVLDERPLTIASVRGGQYKTAVAARPGGGWTVVWDRGIRTRVFATHVDPDGRIENPDGTLMLDAEGHESDGAIAYLDDKATLVWERYADREEYDYDQRIYGATAPMGDLPTAQAKPLSVAPNDQYTPDIAWNGETFLTVWADVREERGSYHVYAARVTPTGHALDGSGKHIVTPGRAWVSPVVASDGDGFLVVWASGEDGYRRDVFALRVGGDGDVIDAEPIVVSDAIKTKGEPDVAWTGSSYLVVWEDYRHAGRGRGVVQDGGNSDIYGARVTSGGEVLDPDGIALASSKRKETQPSLAVGAAGAAVAWGRVCTPEDDETCTYDVLAAPLSFDARPTAAPVKEPFRGAPTSWIRR